MKRLALALIGAWLMVPYAAAQESFRVELGRDGETIADMRPVFLKFETRPMPAISPTEVARRYQRLFQSSNEPEVRIDALNRLTNIRDRTGKDLGFTVEQEEQVYSEVLASYETILGRGTFSGRLDELLYQMAKAYALTGQPEKSIDRLRQLVGLYPNSPLVPEARFRVAESAFVAGDYAEAESGYRTLLDSNAAAALKTKAQYMLGWSQFKQGPVAWDRAAATFRRVLDGFLPSPESLLAVETANVDTIDDTLRVLALMAARENGPEQLLSWLEGAPQRPWAHLLFDRLADFYAQLGDYDASAAANRTFVRHYPEHPETPAFMVQLTQVWARAGEAGQVREAQAAFVAMFSEDARFQTLKDQYRAHWKTFSRNLADFHYRRGSDSAAQQALATARSEFAVAADYYEALADRVSSPEPLFRLAGDARLQAGEFALALDNFRAAAYANSDYPEAADAGWAALVLLREGVAGDKTAPEFQPGLASLSEEADRFRLSFPGDARRTGLTADLATQWLETGDTDQALKFAGDTIANPRATPKQRYASWLVVAKVRQQNREYALAERAWKQVLAELPDVDINTGTNPTRLAQQQLATVVYRQGETAEARGDVEAAVRHFQRVAEVLPGSEIAIKGQYDAANTLLKAERWQPAIDELLAFRNQHGGHALATAIGDKLVHAYVASEQPLRAADELLRGAEQLADPWPLKLQAAELYHGADRVSERNQLYLAYLKTAQTGGSSEQHVRQQTFRHRLAKSEQNGDRWREALVTHELASQWHSEQTLAWAARSALVLGAKDAAGFAAISLGQPLADSLERKQQALEQARERFLQAEQLGGERVKSEALFRRAELYRVLAQDLMNSSVPSELNELEAMQYQMLLEEEAFPFEEKAIGLHSDNHQRLTEKGYDPWIGKSLEVLAELNPGRYHRNVRWMSWQGEIGDDA